VRSSCPSVLGPEAGRGGRGPWTGRASSSSAPDRVRVVVSCWSQGGARASTARAVRAIAPHTRWRWAAHSASRLGPSRSSWSEARWRPGWSRGHLPRAARRAPTFSRACGPSRSARTRASTPRPHARTGAGCGGQKVSRRAAPLRVRTTPRTTAQGAPGLLCCIVIAMRHPGCTFCSRLYHRRCPRDTLDLNPACAKNPRIRPLPLEPGLDHLVDHALRHG
jgi:hypothetical protein